MQQALTLKHDQLFAVERFGQVFFGGGFFCQSARVVAFGEIKEGGAQRELLFSEGTVPHDLFDTHKQVAPRLGFFQRGQRLIAPPAL